MIRGDIVCGCVLVAFLNIDLFKVFFCTTMDCSHRHGTVNPVKQNALVGESYNV